MYVKASGQVAQSVEQRIENPCVGGSIPPQATIRFKEKPTFRSWLFCFVWAVSGRLKFFATQKNQMPIIATILTPIDLTESLHKHETHNVLTTFC